MLRRTLPSGLVIEIVTRCTSRSVGAGPGHPGEPAAPVSQVPGDVAIGAGHEVLLHHRRAIGLPALGLHRGLHVDV